MSASALWLYAFAIFATSLAGGLLPLLVPQHREKHLQMFVSLGAGLLLGMAFLHMIPEAAELLPHTFGIWLLLGFLILLVLERFVMVHACEETHCNYHTIGLAAFFGLAVHGIIEGFALASSTVMPHLASLVLIAILAHKAPAGVALTSILRMSSKSKKQILLFVIGVALSGPAGILGAYLFLKSESISNTAGALLALSAGTFLYIAACDLLPELHKADKEKGKNLVAFFVGLIISYLGDFLLHH